LKLSFIIAFRYFFTKRKKSAVNIISNITLSGISITVAALVIILSVFNGFEKVILDMYNNFDPHLKIYPIKGKTFNYNDIKHHLSEDISIKDYSVVLEEKFLLEYNNKKIMCIVKGVDSNYSSVVKTEKIIKEGRYFSDTLSDFQKDVVILGSVISYELDIDINNPFSYIKLLCPKKSSNYIRDKSDIIETLFSPIGIFSVQADYDNSYLIVPIGRLQKILNVDSQCTFIEIMLHNENELEEFKNKIIKVLGNDYIVKTRIEQHDFLYKLLNSEKLVVFLILVFILIISSFNIISSLTMLMIEKKNDIYTLSDLGSNKRQIENIFLINGLLSVFCGTIIGIIIGVSFCIIQEKYGIISMHGNFIVDSYPVKILLSDIYKIFFTVSIIGILVSYYPAKVLTNKFLKKRNH